MTADGWSGGAGDFLRRLFAELRWSNVSFIAGSIAYGAFISLLPLSVLVLLAASVIGGEAFASFVGSATASYLTPVAQELLSEAITQAEGRTGASVIGVLALLWGMSTVFRNLDVAFSTLYRTAGENGFVDRMTDALVVVLGIGAATAAMFVASAVYAVFPTVPFLSAVPFLPAVNLLLLIAALAVAFFPIYYVFPDLEVTLREVAPGTVVAAVGWTVLQGTFQLYVAYSAASQLYGVLGGVILLATWLYFGSLVVLVGAAVNVVLARRDAATPARTPDAAGQRWG